MPDHNDLPQSAQLTDYVRLEIRQLQTMDPMDTCELHNRASIRLITQVSVASIRMDNGFLYVKPLPDNPHEEIHTDQQIEEVAPRILQRAPSKSKTKWEKKRQNRLNASISQRQH